MTEITVKLGDDEKWYAQYTKHQDSNSMYLTGEGLSPMAAVAHLEGAKFAVNNWPYAKAWQIQLMAINGAPDMMSKRTIQWGFLVVIERMNDYKVVLQSSSFEGTLEEVKEWIANNTEP